MKKLLTKGLIGVIGMTLIPTVISCGHNGKKRQIETTTTSTPTWDNHSAPDPNLTSVGLNGVTNQEMTLEQKTDRAQAFLALHSKDLAPMTYVQLAQLVSEHPNVPWQRGISRFALTQTCSYLINAARELGYKSQTVGLKNKNDDEPLADPKIKVEREATFKALNNSIGALKEVDARKKDAIVTSEPYLKNHFWFSEGDMPRVGLLEDAGLDVSSLGTPNTADRDSWGFSNFTFDLKNGNPFTPSADKAVKENYGEVGSVVLQQYIDAAEPGSVITNLIVPAISDKNGVLLSDAFTKTVRVSGMEATYPIEDAKDREHNLSVLKATILQLASMFDAANQTKIDHLENMAAMFNVAPDTLGAMEWLGRNFETTGGYTMQQVQVMYDKLNNGSHYFKALESAIRGLVAPLNVDTMNAQAPTHDDLTGIIYSPVNEIAGNLNRWSIFSGEGAYVFADAKNYVADPSKGTLAIWKGKTY